MHLTLNDPTRCNAMDYALAEQLTAKLDALEAGELGEVRAVVYSGTGKHQVGRLHTWIPWGYPVGVDTRSSSMWH